MLSKKELSAAYSPVGDKAEDFKKRTVRYGLWNLDIDPEALSRNVCMFREVRGGLSMNLTISVRFAVRFRWFGQRGLVYRVRSRICLQ